MRDIRFLLKAEYGQSHALVIGINRYARASPLGYAVNDAKAVAEKLIADFGFAEGNVTLLLDEAATAEGIRRAFLAFANQDRVGLDDRIVIFFAGHGTTRSGARGEVGYLVPYDADLSDLSTLLRWDDLTRNAEIVAAKHMLFVMDACYGGLAVTRSMRAGSARFVKDMLGRFSRQVLTAGKADETVADLGGPLPGHSVFTGHFLQGLEGGAATPDGVLTASGLMAYVYGRVSADAGSLQTPHFGHLEGDGDFIFKMPVSVESGGDKGVDALFLVPYPPDQPERSDVRSKVARVKHLLAQPDRAIELHDFVIDEVKHFLAATGEDSFKTDTTVTVDEMIVRLTRYEDATLDLSVIEACIAYWATPPHRHILRKALARSVDRLDAAGGMSLWLALRWYPLVLQVYCSGIAAVAAGRYDTLADLFRVDIRTPEGTRLGFRAVTDAVLALTRANAFKLLPDHDRFYTPMSEYLFKLLQPRLDDALFLGRSYEEAFDEFEVLLALACAQAYELEERSVWGPIGRFGWKGRSHEVSPLAQAIANAREQGEKWAPFEAGVFGVDHAAFLRSADAYKTMVAGLSWS